jgi:hypothetical protein
MFFQTPDQGTDAAKEHAKDIQRMRGTQHDKPGRTTMLAQLRLILLRITGRQTPPASRT